MEFCEIPGFVFYDDYQSYYYEEEDEGEDEERKA